MLAASVLRERQHVKRIDHPYNQLYKLKPKQPNRQFKVPATDRHHALQTLSENKTPAPITKDLDPV
jgi:hypothetical protein